jgi:nucleoside-diphosphate-sugar epimerase
MCLFFPNQLELIIDSIKSKYIFVSSAAANNRYIDYYGEYAKDKLAVEDMLVDSNLDYVIVRPSYKKEELEDRNRLNYYLESIQNETPIKIDGDGSNKINMVFSVDVVNVLDTLIKYWVSSIYRFYYACGNDSVNILEFVNYVNEKYYQKEVKFSFNQDDAIFPKNDFVLSNRYTCRDLDISFTSFYPGIIDYVEHVHEVPKS